MCGGCGCVVSTGHEYVCATRGLGIVYSAVDVLGMSLARGGVESEASEWIRGLGLGFTNPVGTW